MAALLMVYLTMPLMPCTLQYDSHLLLVPVQSAHPGCHGCQIQHVRESIGGWSATQALATLQWHSLHAAAATWHRCAAP